MLRCLPVSCRVLCLALTLCVALNPPGPIFPQDAPPPQPPPDAPATQPGAGEEQPPSAGEKAPAAEEVTVPEEAEPPEPPPPAKAGATLKGKLTGPDRKSPESGARVHAIAKDGRVFTSAPADAKGRYVLTGIEPGTYRLAVSTGEGVFSLETEVGITSANVFTVDLATVPAEAARGTVPGLELGPRGFAAIVQGKKRDGGTTFWGSAKGIVLLSVSAVAVALILSQDGDGEPKPVSPSLP